MSGEKKPVGRPPGQSDLMRSDWPIVVDLIARRYREDLRYFEEKGRRVSDRSLVTAAVQGIRGERTSNALAEALSARLPDHKQAGLWKRLERRLQRHDNYTHPAMRRIEGARSLGDVIFEAIGAFYLYNDIASTDALTAHNEMHGRFSLNSFPAWPSHEYGPHTTIGRRVRREIFERLVVFFGYPRSEVANLIRIGQFLYSTKAFPPDIKFEGLASVRTKVEARVEVIPLFDEYVGKRVYDDPKLMGRSG